MRTKQVLAVLGLLALNPGCSDWRTVVPTPDGYQAQLESYVGTSINEVVQERGAPARMVELALGSRTYIWEERSQLKTTVKGREHTDPQTGQKVVTVTGGDRVPFDCVTELDVDADGIVTGYRSEGPACLAKMPGGGATTNVKDELTTTPTVQHETTEAAEGPAVDEPEAGPEHEPTEEKRSMRRRKRDRTD